MLAARDDVRRLLGEGKRQTEIARELGITAGRVSQLVKELGGKDKANNGKASTPTASPSNPQKKENRGKPHKKELHPHDGRRQNRGTPPPGPHSTGFEPGNDRATKTGERRNPFLHFVPEEDARRAEGQADKTPVELQRDSVVFYDARLFDMTRRMAKLQNQRKEMLTTEAEWVRQEGDGETAGTFRQAKRKRKRLDDLIFELHEAITRTQSKRDAAVSKLHDMTKADAPTGNNAQQFQDALNATAEDVWGEEGGTGNEEA